jgi:Ser/Thr protein kinase RdoA (MazF antagonist)
VSGIDALAAEAASHWPQITGAPVLVMHRENSVLRVETRLGPHALRLHRPGYHSDAALRSELDWMAMLAENGMQVPTPVLTRDGQFLAALAGDPGRRASLLSWLPGRPMGETRRPLAFEGPARPALFRALGRQMARMHQLSDGWTLPAGFQRPLWDAEGLVGEAPFWGPFWTIDAPARDIARFVQVREQAQQALKHYQAEGADFGLIHADLVRENVLVDDPDPRHSRLRFIDFDDCGFGFRMFDLATTILKNLDEPDADGLEQALLDGYCEIRPLSQADLAMLPLFLVLRALTYLGWAQSRPRDPDIAARSARFLQVARQVIARRMP